MPGDAPADVRATLLQLLGAARERVAAGDPEAATDLLGTVRTVARNKVPDPDRAERIAHGCDRAAALAADDPAAARAYLEALERRLGR